jgi:predicted aspartyl protease
LSSWPGNIGKDPREFNLFLGLSLRRRGWRKRGLGWILGQKSAIYEMLMRGRFNQTMRFFGRGLGLGLAVGLGGLGIFPSSLPAQLGPVFQSLDYETVTLRRTAANHWYVVGRLEERRRSCLVDTGWSFTTVTTNTAQRLAQTNSISRMRLGQVQFTNTPVRVANLQVNDCPTAYDVVLGADFLLRHHAILDCGRARLYLRQNPPTPTEQERLERELRDRGWVPVTMNRRTPPTWSVAAQINDQPVELLVDNGATWSCLDPQFARLADLHPQPSLHQISGPAATGSRNISVAQVRNWRWGEQIVSPRSVAVFPLGEWGLGPQGKLYPEVGGILGGAELLAAQAVIDCSGDKLWIRGTERR